MNNRTELDNALRALLEAQQGQRNAEGALASAVARAECAEKIIETRRDPSPKESSSKPADEELADYERLSGLLRARFPARPDGSLPDYRVEDVLARVAELELEVVEARKHLAARHAAEAIACRLCHPMMVERDAALLSPSPAARPAASDNAACSARLGPRGPCIRERGHAGEHAANPGCVWGDAGKPAPSTTEGACKLCKGSKAVRIGGLDGNATVPCPACVHSDYDHCEECGAEMSASNMCLACGHVHLARPGEKGK